jgi:hypothetical protein
MLKNAIQAGGEQMAQAAEALSGQTLVDGLIATFRELNMKVRQLPEQTLTGKGSDGSSVHDVVRRLRDDELRFSQALKERLTGVPIPDIFGADDAPVLGTETQNESTAEIISQFGTARESTLAMIQSLTDEEWDRVVEGGASVRARIQGLLENDRKQLDRILSLIQTK